METQGNSLLKNIFDERLSYLNPNELEALESLVNRLRRRYGDDLQRLVLFGSKARGDFDEESDLDVLVVVRMLEGEYWQHWNRIIDLTYDLELEYNVVFSLLIKNEPEYALMRQWNLLINRNIDEDGIELWTSQQSEPSFG
jgi:predicted nucleotidyltransferase